MDGAAGELYMFEYLKRLNSPGSSLQNRKSSIRNQVSIHPDYYDGPDKDSDHDAIADIEYSDHQGKLTEFWMETVHLL